VLLGNELAADALEVRRAQAAVVDLVLGGVLEAGGTSSATSTARTRASADTASLPDSASARQPCAGRLKTPDSAARRSTG
jgi:hypothetical protein